MFGFSVPVQSSEKANIKYLSFSNQFVMVSRLMNDQFDTPRIHVSQCLMLAELKANHCRCLYVLDFSVHMNKYPFTRK